MKDKIIDRNYYFNVKRSYLFYKTLLIIIRFSFAFILIFLIIYISIYSNAKELTETQIQRHELLSNIARIFIPTFIAIWIIIRIVVFLYVKKLRDIKKHVEITDEI